MPTRWIPLAGVRQMRFKADARKSPRSAGEHRAQSHLYASDAAGSKGAVEIH
jgi:hypothetical protein